MIMKAALPALQDRIIQDICLPPVCDMVMVMSHPGSLMCLSQGSRSCVTPANSIAQVRQ